MVEGRWRVGDVGSLRVRRPITGRSGWRCRWFFRCQWGRVHRWMRQVVSWWADDCREVTGPAEGRRQESSTSADQPKWWESRAGLLGRCCRLGTNLKHISLTISVDSLRIHSINGWMVTCGFARFTDNLDCGVLIRTQSLLLWAFCLPYRVVHVMSRFITSFLFSCFFFFYI